MALNAPVIQGIYTALTSAVRAATQTLTRDALLIPQTSNALNPNTANLPEASGLVAYLNVTAAPGVETLQLVLEEQDPVSLVWNTVCATTATTVTGMVRLKIKPSVTAVAASITGVVVQDVLPALWRLRVVHSAASNWTYSLGLVMYT